MAAADKQSGSNDESLAVSDVRPFLSPFFCRMLFEDFIQAEPMLPITVAFTGGCPLTKGDIWKQEVQAIREAGLQFSFEIYPHGYMNKSHFQTVVAFLTRPLVDLNERRTKPEIKYYVLDRGNAQVSLRFALTGVDFSISLRDVVLHRDRCWFWAELPMSRNMVDAFEGYSSRESILHLYNQLQSEVFGDRAAMLDVLHAYESKDRALLKSPPCEETFPISKRKFCVKIHCSA